MTQFPFQHRHKHRIRSTPLTDVDHHLHYGLEERTVIIHQHRCFCGAFFKQRERSILLRLSVSFLGYDPFNEMYDSWFERGCLMAPTDRASHGDLILMEIVISDITEIDTRTLSNIPQNV
ncbi:hypothetical protein EVAR_60874_1 [Eumeta japonica]|uniref:Uncharacterized protein n=1 Tax=Eumeta variegata TaxID=151549 RepID=A0A4C1YKJ6_EUMVA|nr:hypothetical protein EVAR_60874_1 [Eumeta japonica]